MPEKQSNNGNMTRGVETLLGEPKRAIIKLALPMITAMSIQTAYNLADAAWVSGIDVNALSAVGFFFPFLMLIMALANGLGVGAGSAISRNIGAGEKKRAGRTAEHSIVLILIIAISFTGLMLLGQKHIFSLMGAGLALEKTLSYSTIMFSGSIFFFFGQTANNILRSEGDANRAMLAMILGAGLNILLDPFFIYRFPLPFSSVYVGLDLGLPGAAYATILSMGITNLLLIFWLFIKKNTYVNFHFLHFKWYKPILKDIFKVGFPATIAQASMAINMFAVMRIISHVNGTAGVAIFNAGWRIVMIAILPLLGMATAVTAVCGAAYGAKRIDKMDKAYLFAILLGLGAETFIALMTFIFAPFIVKVFTWSEQTRALAPDIINMLRILAFSYPTIAGGMLSSAMFQGTGHGHYSLFLTVLRTIILALSFSYLFAIIFGMGQRGVYFGLISGNISTSIISFFWARYFIHKQKKKFTGK